VVSFALNGLPEQFHKQFNQPAANTGTLEFQPHSPLFFLFNIFTIDFASVGKAPTSRILLEPRPEAPKPLDTRSLYQAYEFVNVATPQRRRSVIIEPLTHSLRSPQYDATKDIELLEDRSSLILLPNALPPSVVYQRAILLDLGTRDFASGMHWFLHHYPMVFDEIHAFELRTDGIFTVPPAEVIRRDYGARARPFEQGKFYFHNALVSTVDRTPSKDAKLSDEELAAMYGTRGMHWRWLRQNPKVPAVDLARLILEEVQPDKDDLVVMKMDLEGSEYDLVEHLRAKGVLPLIDEIFIESHFDAPDMRVRRIHVCVVLDLASTLQSVFK
jgi:hypothetical protein